jgi:hypothetical protein
MSKTKGTQQGKLLHNSGNVTTKNTQNPQKCWMWQKTLRLVGRHAESMKLMFIWMELRTSATFNKPRKIQAWLILPPLRWKRYIPPKFQLTLNGLQGVISQKIVLHNHRCEKLKSYINFVDGTAVATKKYAWMYELDFSDPAHFAPKTFPNHGWSTHYSPKQPNVMSKCCYLTLKHCYKETLSTGVNRDDI